MGKFYWIVDFVFRRGTRGWHTRKPCPPLPHLFEFFFSLSRLCHPTLVSLEISMQISFYLILMLISHAFVFHQIILSRWAVCYHPKPSSRSIDESVTLSYVLLPNIQTVVDNVSAIHACLSCPQSPTWKTCFSVKIEVVTTTDSACSKHPQTWDGLVRVLYIFRAKRVSNTYLTQKKKLGVCVCVPFLTWF